jgi:hypothetical protein
MMGKGSQSTSKEVLGVSSERDDDEPPPYYATDPAGLGSASSCPRGLPPPPPLADEKIREIEGIRSEDEVILEGPLQVHGYVVPISKTLNAINLISL